MIHRVARRYGPPMLFIAVLALVWFGNYNNRRDNRDSQLSSCTRSLFERVDSIRSDQRQAGFFAAAAVARRATSSGKVDQETADEYERFAAEAKASADRREKRLLGAHLVVLGAVTRDGEPTVAARADALRACETVVPPVGIF